MPSLGAWGGRDGGERTFLHRQLFQAQREMGTEGGHGNNSKLLSCFCSGPSEELVDRDGSLWLLGE